MNRFQILKLPEDHVPCLSLKEFTFEEIKKQIIRDYIKTARGRAGLNNSMTQSFFTGSWNHEQAVSHE